MTLTLSDKLRGGTGIFLAVLIALYALGMYWSGEPEQFKLKAEVTVDSHEADVTAVIGYTTTTALIRVLETMLDKPGGYLSNDVLPPSVFLDNIPAWEFGVLEMSRDMALIMRKDFSRSQSQSVENEFLKIASPQLNIDSTSWMMPSAEGEYRKGIKALYAYRLDLTDKSTRSSQFFSRSDNLRNWIMEATKRMGSYSQRLSASVGREQLNVDLAGDEAAQQSTNDAGSMALKTPWLRLDDEFYEARGATWALLHFLRAIEIDFADVLGKKNATVSVQQIIRELEATQETVYSPFILNGSGFGLVANHSLVMANYISRANAALIDLNELLSKG